jgi:hypothetical protein
MTGGGGTIRKNKNVVIPPQGDKKMKQTTKPQQQTKTNIPHALREEIVANREILKRVDENAAFDTPESLAALRSVIEQLKVKTSAIILFAVWVYTHTSTINFL